MMKLLLASNLAATAAVVAFAVPVPAAADPDLAALPVDPNVITDSTAYTGQPPIVNPNGQTGIEQTFAHRDGSRQIIDTIISLPDPQAAVAALEANRSASANVVTSGKTTSVPVGQNGVLISGTSPDGTQAVSVLLFTRGATAAQIQFQGGARDPVPTDLVVDYGQRQDDAISQFVP